MLNSFSGIRSYDPSSIESIEFFKPLTIIWGHNGAGKTVISNLLNRPLLNALSVLRLDHCLLIVIRVNHL
jgi:hypothetical protein